MGRCVISSASKKEKRCDDGGIDIISNLPEDVIYHIFSFLSIVDIVRMSVLSRRWRYSWISASNIDVEDKRLIGINNYLLYLEDTRLFGINNDLIGFEETKLIGINNDLLEFLDRLLTFHDSLDIRSLRLRLCIPDKFPRLNKWIAVAIDHNIKELDLHLVSKAQYELPRLFTCRSVVVLKINAKLTFKTLPCTFFPNLKKLILRNVTFRDDQSTQLLFSSCPVLDELTLVDCIWKHITSVTIAIPTLKSLGIELYGNYEDEAVVGCMIKISSINLTSFQCRSDLIVDIALCKSLFLESASLDIPYPDLSTNEISHRTQRLLSAICKVKILAISYETVCNVLMAFDCFDDIPTFFNVTHMTLGMGLVLCMSTLIEFLKKTPQLENLDIEIFYDYSFGDDGDLEIAPSCFNSSLKIVSITYKIDEEDATKLVGFVLRNATVLQRMIISFYCKLPEDTEKLNVLQHQLNMVPKASESCVIEWRRK